MARRNHRLTCSGVSFVGIVQVSYYTHTNHFAIFLFRLLFMEFETEIG